MMRDSTGTLSSLAEAAKGNSQAHHVEFVSPQEVFENCVLKLQNCGSLFQNPFLYLAHICTYIMIMSLTYPESSRPMRRKC